MPRTSIFITLVLAFFLLSSRNASVQAEDARLPRIQIALLLDTSNSMDGLIDQAKAQLWNVVNAFDPARQNGRAPVVQVALYEYGHNDIPAAKRYVRQILPLTTDLDGVSEKLFALSTRGGDEYCGAVIQSALLDLNWTKVAGDIRVICIAGNEPFTQGPVDYRAACKTADKIDVVVNAIFCGPRDEGIRTKWEDGARLANGAYVNIDQDHKAKHIPAPQDEEILRLGIALNDTYVPFGAQGTLLQARQVAQDENAVKLGKTSAVSRAGFKGSSNYRNAHWDLVDAVEEKRVRLADIRAEDLPEAMRSLDLDGRAAYVQEKSRNRAEIRGTLKRLNDERSAFVAEEQKRQAEAGQLTLDRAVTESIRELCRQRNFQFN